MRTPHVCRLVLLLGVLVPTTDAQQSFVNWETPHVHPIELTEDAGRLLAVNTADGMLEVFDLASGSLVHERSIPVGIDPVSVRILPGTPALAFVVNHLSDSVSAVNLDAGRVVATVQTADEPCDVVFAGTPPRMFVSCSQPNLVQVFDLTDLTAPVAEVPIFGEEPRAMQVSADGTQVYVAVFESGNGTTILGGGLDSQVVDFPPNVVNEPFGPYGGQNPPPNNLPAGSVPDPALGKPKAIQFKRPGPRRPDAFVPPFNPDLPPPPAVSLIVKKMRSGRWLDDVRGDWTQFVSGASASESGRTVGWDLPDHDLAILDAASLSVTYANRLMNICMALGVNPATGAVFVVGTDAINEQRFEPNVKGIFVRVKLAAVAPGSAEATLDVDLNSHLAYDTATVPGSLRDRSLGDPRGIAWSADGARAYITGMGSNNVIVVNENGARVGSSPTIEVGEGPTGIVLDPVRNRLYVLNKFEASVSTISLDTELELERTPFYDPTPTAIRKGRKHLYATHENSGLGHISCASCHVDARTDRLAWDLGDPSGSMKSIQGQNFFDVFPFGLPPFEDWHPMKGPMTTQTLQDIIGKEPLHWRGDRAGLEEFNGAFVGLQGDPVPLTPTEMQEFEDFLATITLPPNPFRNLDNSLSTDLPLPGHYSTGDFAPAGTPLPNGNAQRGHDLYRPPNFLAGNFRACATCHTLPTGTGTNTTLDGFFIVPFPKGPMGEEHTALSSTDGFTNKTMKISQLRTLYEKVGFEATQTQNTSGFGFLHDGTADSLARFISPPAFLTTSTQDIADLVAFLLSFSGSDFTAPAGTGLEPFGPESQDTHAAVGRQVTISSSPVAPPALTTITQMVALADQGSVGFVVETASAGKVLGWAFVGGTTFQSARAGITVQLGQFLAAASPGLPLTFTVVPLGSETRIALDRDEDGFFDLDEIDNGSDPADPRSVPCLLSPPAAPVGLAVATLGKKALELTWTDVATDEDEYSVLRKRIATGEGFERVVTLPAGTTGFVDTDLACAARYAYRVEVSNCAGTVLSARAEGRTADCARSLVEYPPVNAQKP